MILFKTPAKYTDGQKFELMKFVYDNTDSFIMNTFGWLWETRKWWGIQHIDLIDNEKGEIMALHAYSVNVTPGILKTYYIVTAKSQRGKGLAKALTFHSLRKHQAVCTDYYVNSEENSDGVAFYKKLFNSWSNKPNEFGTLDFIFKQPINEILNEQTL